MTVSQAILASINGQGSGGGGGTKSASWSGIDLEPMNEGQTNTVYLNFTNWDGSLVYYNIIGVGNNPASTADFDYDHGSIQGPWGSGTGQFSFTALADATIEGNQTYMITVGTSDGATDIADGSQGTYTIRDTSQNPQLILDLDPALCDLQGYPTSWPDASNRTTPAVLHNTTYSTDGGGSFVFNGSDAYAEVPLLNSDWRYPNATVSIWFKEDTDAVAAIRALISKELIFKLEMMDDGFIRVLANGKGYAPWDADVVSNGSEHFRHGQWNNLTFTRTDQDAGFVYLNGVEFMSFSGGLYGSNSFPFIIGGYSDGSSPSYLFQGWIAQVKMWNYARTPQQIWGDFVSEVNRYIPQLPQFDLTWNNTTNTFDDGSGVLVNINSATASVENNGPYSSGLIWPGTSGDYIDILGSNYIQSTFTLSIVAKFNISGDHYNTLFDGSELDRVGNGIWANIWSNEFSVGTQDQNYGLTDMTDYPSNQVAWWDFVFTPTSVALYKNGLPVGSHATTGQGKLWYDNLRIGAEYNQTGNNMAGVYYRFKYQKTALTPDQIILQYNSNCGLYELPPIPLSMVFDGSSSYLDVAGNTGDWALGDNYTIEWWQKPDNSNWGCIMSASNNEADVHNCIDIFITNGNVYASRQGWGTGTVPSGIWNHIAVVNNNGSHQMFFNGIKASYTYNPGLGSSYAITDNYEILRIGRTARNYPMFYAGKITGIRVSDRVLYTTNFTPELSPVSAGSVKLVMNSSSGFTDATDYMYGVATMATTSSEAGGITYLKFATNNINYQGILTGISKGDLVEAVVNSAPSQSTVAADPFNDGTYIVVPVLTSWWSTTNNAGSVNLTHTPRRISNINVSVSQDVPKSLTGTQGESNGGSYSQVSYNYGNPLLMSGAIQSVPVGAAITSNISGFGVRTVLNAASWAGGWMITYDATGLSGTTSTSDVFNYYW